MAFACTDNNGNDEAAAAPIRIVESDKTYQSQGDSGTITFEADGPVSVSTDQIWCSATLSGNKVTVTVDANHDVLTRSANVVFTLGDYTTKVNILQEGVVFAFFPEGYSYTLEWESGNEVRLLLDAQDEVTVTDCPSWLDTTVEDNYLVVKTNSNNYTNIKTGDVAFKMYDIAKKITVTQLQRLLEYDEYIGTWNMTYYNSSSVFAQSTVTLSAHQAGTSYLLSGLTFDMIVNYVNGRLEFYTNQVVGIHTEGGVDYNIIIRVVNDATTSSTATGAGMYSSYIIDEEDNDRIIVTLHNNGVYADGTGFGFYRTVGTTNTVYAKYRTVVKLYKQ